MWGKEIAYRSLPKIVQLCRTLYGEHFRPTLYRCRTWVGAQQNKMATHAHMSHEVVPDALPYVDQGYDEPGVREMVSITYIHVFIMFSLVPVSMVLSIVSKHWSISI